MPIYGWLQWAEKKCRKTHFPPQTAAAITPQEKEKASLHKGVCTHKYTFSVMWVNCRLGNLPAGPNREGAAYSSRGSPGPNVWLVTTKVTGTGYTQSYPSTRDRCSKDMWSISTPYTNQIWWHMAIGSSSYCACLTEFLFQTSSSILSLDIQVSKDGKTNNKTYRQADSRAGPFLLLLPENAISLDQASLPKLSFSNLTGQPAFHHGNLPYTRFVIGSCNH